MDDKLKGKGPFITIDGKPNDAGLYNHVTDGTDDAYDKVVKMKKVKEALKKELEKRTKNQ